MERVMTVMKRVNTYSIKRKQQDVHLGIPTEISSQSFEYTHIGARSAEPEILGTV